MKRARIARLIASSAAHATNNFDEILRPLPRTRLDVVEVFSPARVGPHCIALGLRAELAIDLKTGWDLSTPEGRSKAMHAIDAADYSPVFAESEIRAGTRGVVRLLAMYICSRARARRGSTLMTRARPVDTLMTGARGERSAHCIHSRELTWQ